jgi:hypothetical protein
MLPWTLASAFPLFFPLCISFFHFHILSFSAHCASASYSKAEDVGTRTTFDLINQQHTKRFVMGSTAGGESGEEGAEEGEVPGVRRGVGLSLPGVRYVNRHTGCHQLNRVLTPK